MNLSEALDAALPELPRTRLATRFAPRLDPEVVVREDILDGMRSISILQRSSSSFARLSPEQWELAQLFDGGRSYAEIAEVALARTGAAYTEDELREFAEGIEQCGFWYKSPQEKNLAMSEKLATHRCRRSHGGGVSLAHISFSAWDPDRYLTALDRRIGKYVYSGWFTALAVLLFVFEASVFAVKWSTFGPDVHRYYQFTEKSGSDLLEFWLLFFFLGFLHETAHGLTCKHFGGQVHSMGFLLLYLTPAFFCDITEVWVAATRGQRLAAIIAGIWTELVVCGFATVVWTNTLPGQWQHDLAYKVMLLTGVAVVVLNVNPLLKLDGYYFLTEWLRIPDLKERSTGFVSASVQRYIFRMPVEIPMVSVKRVPLMVFYAVASGAYSYFVLFSVLRLAYNIFFHFFAELALVPVAALAFGMFRARLRTMREFVSKWIRTQRDAGRLRLGPLKLLLAAAAIAVLVIPIWRDREDAYYVIEPAQTAVIHTTMPGRITAVYVHEGQLVQAGEVVATAASLDESSTTAESGAQLLSSQQNLFQAEVSHTAVGEARTEAEGAARRNALALEQHQRLSFAAPFAGTIVSSSPESLVNQTTGAGEPLLTIADTTRLKARVFLPEPEMAHIHPGDEVVFEVSASFRHPQATLGSIDGPATELPAGVIESQQFAGTKLASFYTAVVPLGADAQEHGSKVRVGMSGRAKVFGVRRSLLSRTVAVAVNQLRTHFW
jgi:putative peptide zinc metalloprotease protein